MDTFNNVNPNEPMGGEPAPAGSKLGMIGLIVGILGVIVYCGPLAAAFLMGATGNVPDPGSPVLIAIGLASYCGSFISNSRFGIQRKQWNFRIYFS